MAVRWTACRTRWCVTCRPDGRPLAFRPPGLNVQPTAASLLLAPPVHLNIRLYVVTSGAGNARLCKVLWTLQGRTS